MRLILAHAADAAARAAARRWGQSALLLTPQDLHGPAWRLDLDRGGTAVATLRLRDGTSDGAGTGAEVDSVLSRLGGVAAAELTRIRPQDRDYAAAELTAFLRAWLDACPCRVLNPPSAGSLSGPAWQPEHWALAAAREGLAVRPVRRRVVFGEPAVEPGPEPAVELAAEPGAEPVADGAARRVSVTVVGDRTFGPAHEATRRRLRALSRASGAPLLVAGLEGAGEDAVVLEVSAWPDVGDPEIADAVASALEVG